MNLIEMYSNARYYGNEDSVGKALAESGIAREELYITSKFDAIGGESVEVELQKQLKDVRLPLDGHSLPNLMTDTATSGILGSIPHSQPSVCRPSRRHPKSLASIRSFERKGTRQIHRRVQLQCPAIARIARDRKDQTSCEPDQAACLQCAGPTSCHYSSAEEWRTHTSVFFFGPYNATSWRRGRQVLPVVSLSFSKDECQTLLASK